MRRNLAAGLVVALTGLGTWLGVMWYRDSETARPETNPAVRTIEWRGEDSGYRGRTTVYEDGTHVDTTQPATRPAAETSPADRGWR